MSDPITTLTGTQIPLDAAYVANLAAQNTLTARGQDVSAANAQLSAQTQIQIANQQAATQAQAARQQYYVDVARIGVDAAQVNYQQRLGAIQTRLQYNQQLTTAQQGRASTKLQALSLLASRSGPQDWVAYNNLLDKMGTPTGQAVDPTKWADDITDPVMPDTSGLYQPVNPSIPAPDAAGVGGDRLAPPLGANYGGGTAPATTPNVTYPAPYPGSQPAAAPALRPGGSYLGVPNEQVADIGKGQSVKVQTGTLGGSKASDYSGFFVADDQDRPLIGDAPIAAGATINLRRLARGGLINDMAFIAGEGRGRELGQDSEVVINPTGAPLGVLSHEEAVNYIQEARGQRMGRYAGGTGMAWPDMRARASAAWSGGAPSAVIRPPRPARSASASAPQPTVQQPILTTPPATAPAVAPAPGSQPTVTQPVNNATAPGQPSYGMSPLPTYTTYDANTLGNQPFYRKLIGSLPANDFSGFGATLNNDRLGIHDAPWALNLQRYMSLNPSERDQTQSLYQQGLGVDFRDMLEQARRASPMGSSFGPARFGG